MRSRGAQVLVVLVALLGGVVAVGAVSPAQAHEERPAGFPDGTGHRPRYAGLDNPRHRVVCTRDSGRRIRHMKAGVLKRRNLALLKQCRYGSIQTAIDSIRRRHTSVYVLPGYYTESRWASARRSSYCSHLSSQSQDPLPASEYIGSLTDPQSGAKKSDPIALSYADQRRCRHNLNLIAIMGDRTPDNGSIHCDSVLCGTQLVGTGATQGAVVIDNRFKKLNAIRADRAGGVVFRNFTVQQSEFNALYVLETDGFVIDKVTARGNDEYGILAFASDHGLIQRTNAYYNGDSGIYPGSGSDLNADNTSFTPVRYAIEIRHNRSHHNTLGYSGTAGNSIHAHDNEFYDNATGIATDSLFPGHPGLPQDHARWDHNKIFANNSNWYTRYVDTGVCDKPMKDRGYLHGTVCPVVPTPVGTGLLIAGGNYDSTDHNWIFDNWRYGTMQFWVPSPLRDEYDPTKLYDTSNHNHSFANRMGLTPAGAVRHNGLDFWWDDEGEGNCWEHNASSRGTPTDNFTVDPPSCAAGGSVRTPGLAVKDAGFLSCSQYDRSDPAWKHPAACDWFDSPSRPTGAGGTSSGPLDLSAGRTAPATGGPELLTLGIGVLVLGGLAAGRRGRRPASGKR
jgi:Right handed beta helix region